MEDKTPYFPRQKIATSAKNKKWHEDCAKYAIGQMSQYDSNGLRYSQAQKQVNYNLLNGVLDPSDVEDTMNPLGLKGINISTSLQDYSKMKSKFDLLIGESLRRRFDYAIRSVNPTAVSEREKYIKEEILKQLAPEVDPTKNPQFDEERMRRKLRELEYWEKYSASDLRERMAKHLSDYYYKYFDLDMMFMRGMEDSLAVAEEIYAFDIVNSEPFVEKVSPLNFYVLRAGNSPYIEDGDIFIIDGYYPIGETLDRFNDVLTEAQIKDIEDGVEYVQDGKGFSSVTTDWYAHETGDSMPDGFKGMQFLAPGANLRYLGDAYDSDGNLRVIRVIWKSMRKIGKLKYYDEEGDVQYKWVHETYEPDKSLGEEVTWRWIKEWRHTFRIGADMFVKAEALPRIGYNLDNPSKCAPPIIGTVLSIDQEKQRSLVDVLKPYEYLHAEIMNRLRKAINRFRMPSVDVDLASIPDFMEIEDWIYYDQEGGYRFRDSFKEGKKGEATGKIAGSFQNMEKLFNPDMRNYIDQHIQLLNYIDNEMGIISGITRQREGQIETRELVGNVEVARQQSNQITEKLFALHENTKVRVLATLLEYAKYSLLHAGSKKLPYVSDDLSTKVMEVDAGLIAESEYGIFVTNSREDYELRESLKQLSKSLVQNATINIKDLISILHSPSIAEMRKTLEQSEADKIRREEEQFQQQLKTQEQINESNNQLERDKMNLEEKLKVLEQRTKLMIAGLSKEDADNTIELEKLNLDKEKLELERDKQARTLALDEKEYEEKVRSNKAKEAIALKNKQSSNKK